MAKSTSLALEIVSGDFAIYRLPASSSIPAWAMNGPFVSITKTNDELSIITLANERIPKDLRCEDGWKCLKLRGQFGFELTGILTSILNPLARAEIPILAVSTFDTDYVLIKEKNLSVAIDVLRQNGHRIAT